MRNLPQDKLTPIVYHNSGLLQLDQSFSLHYSYIVGTILLQCFLIIPIMQMQDTRGTVFITDRPQVTPKKKEELKKKAAEESYQEQVKESIMEKQKLDRFAKKSSKLIYQLESVFPFELFPTRIAIHEDKVDVIDKTFFKSAQITGTAYDRLLNVTVTTSLFFAEIDFQFEGFPMNKPLEPIRFLKKKEAIYAVQIMNGLITCSKEKIDISKIDDIKLLRDKLYQIGYSHQRGIV